MDRALVQRMLMSDLLPPCSMAEGLEALAEIRSKTGNPWTKGLKDSIIDDFLKSDPSLTRAIEEASQNFQSLVLSYFQV